MATNTGQSSPHQESTGTWFSKLLFRQPSDNQTTNRNIQGVDGMSSNLLPPISRDVLQTSGDTPYIPILDQTPRRSNSGAFLLGSSPIQSLPHSDSKTQLSGSSLPANTQKQQPQIETVLGSCQCCGTLIKYPSHISRVRCLVCHTNIIVKEVPLLQAPGLEQEIIPPLSYDALKNVISDCKTGLDCQDPSNNNPHIIFKPLEDYLYKSCSSFESLNNSFKLEDNKEVSCHSPNLNITHLKKFYAILLGLPTKRPIFKAFLGALHLLRHPPILKDPSSINWLLILLEIPLLSESLISGNATAGSSSTVPPELKTLCYEIAKRVIGLLCYVDKQTTRYLIHWWSRLPDSEFIKKVDFINLYITFQLTRCINYELYNSVIQPGAYMSNNNVIDDINYKETLNSHFIRPASQSSDFGLSIGMPLYISSGSRRVNGPGTTGSLFFKSEKKKEHDIKIKLQQYGDDWHLRTAGRLASLLFMAKKDRKKINDAIFYNNLADYVNVKQDFDAWQFNCSSSKRVQSSSNNPNDSLLSVIEYIQAESKATYLGVAAANGTVKKSSFTFCQFPFLLSLAAKISILEHEAKRTMERKAEEAFIQSLNQKIPFDVYFKIRVRRTSITMDSLRAIKSHQSDFKKLLRIEFVDEPGIDAGGLKKEWFLLLTKDLFHPEKGLFSYSEESHLGYFAISPLDNSELYYLVGVVLGLAIYNSTILDLRLPKALFKKLMRKKPTLNDFIELNPETGHGLKRLAKMRCAECLDLYFEVTYKDIFGDLKTVPLIKNGSDIKVTDKNKHAYIEAYYSYFLDSLVEHPFKSFSNGFYNVIGGNALSLFTPEEIELILIGDDNNNQKMDINILRSVTKYNGFKPTDLLIQWFWEFFEDLSIRDQKRLLLFVTGSDRLPATGLPSLHMKITRIEHSDITRLPIAHTCFNELCLFNYKSQEVFADKLRMAIECSEGFGLR